MSSVKSKSVTLCPLSTYSKHLLVQGGLHGEVHDQEEQKWWYDTPLSNASFNGEVAVAILCPNTAAKIEVDVFEDFDEAMWNSIDLSDAP